jgi:hypothetical protein
MYHYLGSFQLYENSRVIRQFGYRCQSYIDNVCFDCLIELVSLPELLPSQSTEVQISFISIKLIAPLINIGCVLQICEGSKPVGVLSISHDPWARVEDWIAEGEIRKAVVDRIGWTTAGILMEGNIKTVLTSKDMGLQEWQEINRVLKSGEMLRVLIDKIDKVDRVIRVSFVDRVSSPNSAYNTL